MPDVSHVRAAALSGDVTGRRTVLLATSNGVGLGHVTRLMAAARRLPPSLVPVVVTQSLGASIVRAEGFATEYVMSFSVARMTRHDWREYLYRRFSHLIRVYEPAAIIYDGVVPYVGMTRAWKGTGIPSAWLRRGLWRRGAGLRHIELGGAFDAIIQPGDIAAEVDVGATAADLGRARAIPPVTYLDRAELESAAVARPAVSRSEEPLALISLGAGTINDTRSTTARAVEEVRRHGFRPVVAVSPISRQTIESPGVDTISIYPLSAYLRAFDFVVGAAGYNSVHEYLMAGVPSVLVPNTETGLDDQVVRSRYVERRGVALAAEDDAELFRALEIVADPTVRELMRARLDAMDYRNGADDLAAAIGELAGVSGWTLKSEAR